MHILVTGGAGYVGSHCTRRLLDAGHSVVVLDNLSMGHRAAVDRRAGFIQGDLADRTLVERVIAGAEPGSLKAAEAVMHFAASAMVGESVEHPLRYYRNNVANTLNLLEAMHAASVKRIVFSSTCATYGEPELLPIRENLPQTPVNPYGATKLAVEWMLRDSAAAWGLGAVALRYFNACGAATEGDIGEDHTPETHLIPLVLQVALGQRDSIKIFGTDYPTPDGTCVRDYIHVEDLATAHVAAIEGLTEGRFEAFNVGTGHGVSVRQVIEAARQVTGHAIPATEVARRAGDPPSLFADPARLRERFRWTPRFTDLRGIVQSAWNWHRAYPRGFQS